MNLSRFGLAMWAALLLGLFGVLLAIFGSSQLLVLLNGVFLGTIVAVGIVYAPLIWFTFRLGTLDRVSQLSVGIGLLWASVALQRLWSLYFRYQGAPEKMIDHPMFAFIAYVAIIGGALFVSAPGYPPPHDNTPIDIWTGNRKLLIGLGVLGGTVTTFLAIYPGIRF